MTETDYLNFHGEDVTPSSPDMALFHIIPAPFERSVSYGTGTAQGPKAILQASEQLELFTGKNIPAEHGIYTAPPVNCSGSCEKTLTHIRDSVARTLQFNKIPIVLGGEHTVTCGVIDAIKQYHDDFGVIQFDAHADLRDSYEGSSFSHACVMRRIHELGIPIYQLGTRSYSLEEHLYRKEHAIPFRDSEDIWKNGVNLQLPKDFPQKVFITFDIDGLDSAIMPATGTPVPGGLGWHQAMWLIEAIMEQCICIGFDVVELAPIEQLHGANFTAAQLVYNMMGYLSDSTINRSYWQLDQ